MIILHCDKNITLSLVRNIVASLKTEDWITHTLTLNLTASKRNQQTLLFIFDGSGHSFNTLNKALVIWQDINWLSQNADLTVNSKAKNSNIHCCVDIIIAPWHTVSCVIVKWSKETTFQRDLRCYMWKVKGWKFDSSGIQDQATEKVLNLKTVSRKSRMWENVKKKVFSKLDLKYKESWERCIEWVDMLDWVNIAQLKNAIEYNSFIDLSCTGCTLNWLMLKQYCV